MFFYKNKHYTVLYCLFLLLQNPCIITIPTPNIVCGEIVIAFFVIDFSGDGMVFSTPSIIHSGFLEAIFTKHLFKMFVMMFS